MNEIVILLGAEIDLQALYERQTSLARAERLEDRILAAFQQLVRFPRSASEFAESFRCHRLRSFPYALYSKIEGRRIVIHAALDTRQDQDSIRRRLGL